MTHRSMIRLPDSSGSELIVAIRRRDGRIQTYFLSLTEEVAELAEDGMKDALAELALVVLNVLLKNKKGNPNDHQIEDT